MLLIKILPGTTLLANVQLKLSIGLMMAIIYMFLHEHLEVEGLFGIGVITSN